MSFRKRGVVIGTPKPAQNAATKAVIPGGARPSPLDGRLTTSTGTSSLDQLLAGHSGIPLGTTLLIEENGTTDFGGTLIRYFAAEGLVQGHMVHVLGCDDSWRRELPGLGSTGSEKATKNESADSKMKIAWRYETLGNRPAPSRDQPLPSTDSDESQLFCHTFNLSKRLEAKDIKGQLSAFPVGPFMGQAASSPFKMFLAKLSAALETTAPSVVHRVAIPNLLSPTVYTSLACHPKEVLQLLHALRGLTRRYPTRLVIMTTLPVSLYPRAAGLTRWIELLNDGVLELVPLQQRPHLEKDPKKEDKAQGLLKVHSLPIFHEKGGGVDESWRREDLSFKLSASSGLIITPYSLPPIEDEDPQPSAEKKKQEEAKKSLEF